MRRVMFNPGDSLSSIPARSTERPAHGLAVWTVEPRPLTLFANPVLHLLEERRKSFLLDDLDKLRSVGRDKADALGGNVLDDPCLFLPDERIIHFDGFILCSE